MKQYPFIIYHKAIYDHMFSKDSNKIGTITIKLKLIGINIVYL